MKAMSDAVGLVNVGDSVIAYGYGEDNNPATIVTLDFDDLDQPFSVVWPDGSSTWPEHGWDFA